MKVAGQLDLEKKGTAELPQQGGCPTGSWRNLETESRMSFSCPDMRQKTGSATWLAELVV